MAPPPSKRPRRAEHDGRAPSASSDARGPEAGPSDGGDAAGQREAKLRRALGDFVQMLDLQPEDFRGAFPDLGSDVAQLLQRDFVQALQTAINMSNDAIIRDADLATHLGGLDRLIAQADRRADSAGSTDLPPDTYRENLDLATALCAAENPSHERRLDALRAEIAELEQANRSKHDALKTTQAQAVATQKVLDSTLTSLSQVCAFSPGLCLVRPQAADFLRVFFFAFACVAGCHCDHISPRRRARHAHSQAGLECRIGRAIDVALRSRALNSNSVV